MELDEAKEIVRALADGVDPTTGEVLPQASPYNDPSVIRALFKVIESTRPVKQPTKTNEQRQQDNIDSGKPKNAGLPWTDESKTELSSKYRSGVSIDELCKYYERTKGAIVSELMKQGLVESSNEFSER